LAAATPLQAHAAWQWWNYCCARLPAGKACVKINLDETSVCLFQGDSKGNVFVNKKRLRDEPVQTIPRWKKRCYLTHVAFACDRPDVQPLLPQVIIGNEATLQAADVAALQASCPSNVRLVRQKSAWNNEVLCARIVRWLGRALEPYAATLQPILLMDAARLHTTRRVLAACTRCRIWPVLVPAKMTWLMQPLDTHAFLRYKVSLKKNYERARAASPNRDLGAHEFLACATGAIRHVLQGNSWGSAFDEDGFGHAQAKLSSFVRQQLALDAPPLVPATRPTHDQVKLCFPKRAVVPYAALFNGVGGGAVRGVAAGATAGGTSRPAPAAPPPLRAPRTRAEHRTAAAAAAASSSSGAASGTGPRPLGRTRAQTMLLRARGSGPTP